MSDWNAKYATHQFAATEPVQAVGAYPSGALRRVHSCNTVSPEELCRTALSGLLAPGEELPETRSIALYYIRCLANGTINGEETHGVVFVPEFLYVLDLGYPHLAGVSIGSPRQLHGDPYFPNFAKPEFRSIAKEEPPQLLYPIVAGQLLVSFEDAIDEHEARDRLGARIHDLSGSNGFFEVTCDPFREGRQMVAIEQEVSGVRSVQGNQIVRPKDIDPGWFLDKVL
jgi:hypothetical protein